MQDIGLDTTPVRPACHDRESTLRTSQKQLDLTTLAATARGGDIQLTLT